MESVIKAICATTKFAILVLAFLHLTNGHVRLWQPLSRSSVWRDPRFTHLEPEINWDDDALYCGQIHQPVIVDSCGICGDPIIDPSPRANEHGGIYGRGIIVANYKAESVVEFELEFTTTHLGYVEFQISHDVPETENNFLTLQLTEGGTKVPIPELGTVMPLRALVRLPPGLTCSHCVVRMNYRTGNSWGDCGNGTENLGCGHQETFRHCSDISIST